MLYVGVLDTDIWHEWYHKALFGDGLTPSYGKKKTYRNTCIYLEETQFDFFFVVQKGYKSLAVMNKYIFGLFCYNLQHVFFLVLHFACIINIIWPDVMALFLMLWLFFRNYEVNEECNIEGFLKQAAKEIDAMELKKDNNKNQSVHEKCTCNLLWNRSMIDEFDWILVSVS